MTRVGSLSNQLPSDPGLVKRAAKFSRLGGFQMEIEENKDGILSILSRSSAPEKAEFGDSLEEASVSEQIPSGKIEMKGQRDVNVKKRKTISRGKAKDIPSAPYTKEAKAVAETEESNSKRSKVDEGNQKQSKEILRLRSLRRTIFMLELEEGKLPIAIVLLKE